VLNASKVRIVFIVFLDYRFSELEPFDIAMVSLYFVLDQWNWKTYKSGINQMLLSLKLPFEGLKTEEEFLSRV